MKFAPRAYQPPGGFPMRNRRLIVFTILGVLVTAASCSEKPLRPARSPAAGEQTLSVLSYNLNYGLAGDAPTLEALAARPSDLVLLQETTPEWETALRARFESEYPFIAFR
ncbi:MAG TPA: hypothetical protein VF103_15490, partial [Polyangiaceae bacterium]